MVEIASKTQRGPRLERAEVLLENGHMHAPCSRPEVGLSLHMRSCGREHCTAFAPWMVTARVLLST